MTLAVTNKISHLLLSVACWLIISPPNKKTCPSLTKMVINSFAVSGPLVFFCSSSLHRNLRQNRSRFILPAQYTLSGMEIEIHVQCDKMQDPWMLWYIFKLYFVMGLYWAALYQKVFLIICPPYSHIWRSLSVNKKYKRGQVQENIVQTHPHKIKHWHTMFVCVK